MSFKYLCITLCLFLSVIMITSCAKQPYMEMAYNLPAPSASQIGSQVCLTVSDVRTDPELFGDAAQKEFQNFTGIYALTVVSVDKKRSSLGAYKLEELFQKTLEIRLENMGAEVLQACGEETPVMQVEIKTFKIELINRKWRANVAYIANLTADGKNIIKETVSGKAERIKLVGSKAAQRVVGELFTDMINRLDINRLFDQSRW